MIDNYLVFIGVAITTILLPGPGVLFTLNNSIQRGFAKTLTGILGISLGVLLVASISATSISILLTSSMIAFTIVKVLGALYLIYLGVKMFRTKASVQSIATQAGMSYTKIFFEGFLISITNPKGIVFFLSIFPQFINVEKGYAPQFAVLAATFCLLLVIIHSSYALFAAIAKTKLASERGRLILNKTSGSVFVCFGLGLAASS